MTEGRLPIKMKTTYAIAIVLFVTFGVTPVSVAAPASDSAGVVHILSQKPLAGQPGTDVTVLTVDYPPAGSTPPHEHPGTTYAYVLEGAIISRIGDGQPQTFSKGQMWMEQPHDRHMESKNASATAPAKLLVFMIAPHGAKLTTMLPPD